MIVEQVADDDDASRSVEATPTHGTLRLGWWNTRLAPWRGKGHRFRNDPDQVSIANAVVSQLCAAGIDILALGEATPEAARRVAVGTDYELAHDVRGWGLQVLYVPSRAHVALDKPLGSVLHGRETTRATQLYVSAVGSPHTLVFIVVHWPSRRMHDAEADRSLHGHCLQSHIDRLLRERNYDIVIGGDFNEDPWDRSMVMSLLGTRDRAFVQAHRSALYNPFFRFAGEHQACDLDGEKTGAGTHYWTGGSSAHWWTFDQFLFSASIVRGERWRLLESMTGIWREPPMHESLKAELFDHYPVIAGLAYERTPHGERT